VRKLQALNLLSSISDQFLNTLQLNVATKKFDQSPKKNVRE